MKVDTIPSTTRIETFTDAVMAIIMTLLVLELKVPELVDGFSSQDALKSLVHLMPKFLSFAMSFLVVAIVWVNHHHFFHRLKHSDPILLWCNNSLLFWLCFIPFPTAFIGEHPEAAVPVMLYGFVMFAAVLSFLLMHIHAYRAHLFHKEISRKFLQRENFRGAAAPALYLLSVILAWFSVSWAIGLLIIIPILYFLPASSIESQ
jgi:uncharacterized membrane protein